MHSNAPSAGGIHGRKLQLTSLDDAYDPARTAANTRTLLGKHKVFALVGYVATANLIAALPIAEEAQPPLFAPLVGTTSFRTKHSHYLFVGGHKSQSQRRTRFETIVSPRQSAAPLELRNIA